MLVSTCLIVRLQIAMGSVLRLVESLRDEQANVGRTPQLESVRQLQFLLNRRGMLAIRTSSSLRSKRSRANEELCVARVKILVARKFRREQKRKRSREGAKQVLALSAPIGSFFARCVGS